MFLPHGILFLKSWFFLYLFSDILTLCLLSSERLGLKQLGLCMKPGLSSIDFEKN